MIKAIVWKDPTIFDKDQTSFSYSISYRIRNGVDKRLRAKLVLDGSSQPSLMT